jgi:phosphohistidine swiveling domain-containing protein/nucleoside-diphosphate-sugar epimerase
MRVVVSGLPGDVTSCVVGELARRGHDVTEASQKPQWLFSSSQGGRSGGAAVDALVHVAPVADRGDDAANTFGVGVADAGAMLDAAKRAAVPRVVVISSALTPWSATEDPWCESDRLWRNDMSPTSVLLISATYILGRDSTGTSHRRFAGPIIVGGKGQRNVVQLIHHDDLACFAADAVEHPQWTGQVNLAAHDVVALRDMADILEKPYIELNPCRWARVRRWSGIRRLAFADRLLDTTRLDELGFVPVWTSRDCVTDFRRANRQHVYFGARRVVIPWRFPCTPTPPPRRDGPHRYPANASGGGEFDTTVDPEWPAFTCANVAEAFPGPMTPLSLELAMEAMRATGVLAADIVRMKGEIRRAVTDEHVGCFGHNLYINLTVSRAASAMLPGADPPAWRDLLFGAESGIDVPESGKIGLWGMVCRLPKIVILLAAAARETRRIEGEARERQCDAAYYSGRTDDELLSQLRCVRDAVVSSWAVAALGSAGVVPIMALIERQGGKRFASRFKAGAENLASAGLIRGTYDLGERARSDPSIAAFLRESDSEGALSYLRANHPEFAARVDAVIADYGHRGPGETELSSPVFADTPARLLDAVAKLAGSRERPLIPMPSMGARLRLLARLGVGFQQSRERARDAAMRYTHNYRLIARELGARLAARGVIEQPGDVFYLIRDELTHPPADIRARISRRKAERARLEQYRPPTYFVQRWEPRRDMTRELKPGESLTGIPVSVGKAKGPVRILTSDSIGDLQPGEVLVAECTDTGWTPFFSYAAAVVVDTGAEMSHAAVVAREFSIPCVVGSVAASRVLRTGQVIEVDGSTGRITRVE